MLPALTLALLVPAPAYAAGTVRHDDGTREAAVHKDWTDGFDTVSARFALPNGTVAGSTGAKLWVYAQAVECDFPLSRSGQWILVSPGYMVAEYDPCATWPSTAYGWHAFDVPLDLLRDGTNSFSVHGGTAGGIPPDLLGGTDPRNGHSAYYGIDTSRDVDSTVVQKDATGTHTIAGELMWYLEFTGSVPSMRIPVSSVEFAMRAVGTTSPATTVTVHSNGLENLFPTVTLGGLAPGDFAVTADTCSGATVSPGTSCTFGVTFTPQASGSRYASVEVSAPGVAPKSIALHGEAPTGPPVSGFTTPDGAVLLQTDAVAGVVTGASSIAHEQVAFVPDLPQEPAVSVRAVLSCDAPRTTCTWSVAALLLPGRYTVTADGADLQGNTESPGTSITVTIV